MAMRRFAIIASENVEVYLETRGQNGYAIKSFKKLREAREYAQDVAAYDYDDGVEVVDTAEWRIVECNKGRLQF